MHKRILRFLALGDIHGMGNELLHVLHDGFMHKPDAVISSGDIGSDIFGNLVTFNKERETLYQVHTLSLLLAMAVCKKPVIYVPGNHDHFDWSFADGESEYIFNVDILTGGAATTVNNVCVLGIGGSPRTDGFWINEWDSDSISIEPEALRKWNDSEYRVLLSHSPPINTWLDVDASHTRSLGSKGIRQFLARCERKPHLFLCGHIHESQNIDLISETPAINLGALCTFLGTPFGHHPAKFVSASVESSNYWLIDLFPNKVEARHYQSIGFLMQEFALDRVFTVQNGEALMKEGKAALHLSTSDDDTPIGKVIKTIERRKATHVTPSPSLLSMSAKTKERTRK